MYNTHRIYNVDWAKHGAIWFEISSMIWNHNTELKCYTLHTFPKVLFIQIQDFRRKKIFQRPSTKLICKTSGTLPHFPFIADDIERANTLLERIYAPLNNKHVRIILTLQPHGYGNTAKGTNICGSRKPPTPVFLNLGGPVFLFSSNRDAKGRG